MSTCWCTVPPHECSYKGVHNKLARHSCKSVRVAGSGSTGDEQR